jgi:selT/selW/selH-like putative selenoprotein
LPRASSLQAAIKKRFGFDAKLVGGHGGIFEVTLEGKVIYDKFKTFRFPEEQEVLDLIAKQV